MDNYDIKRLALILAVQAEIEAMKAHNATDNFAKYSEIEFWNRAKKLEEIAYKHNEQL